METGCGHHGHSQGQRLGTYQGSRCLVIKYAAACLGDAILIAVFAPGLRSPAATLNLTTVAFVIGVPACAAHTILPIAAHRERVAPVLAARWHLAVIALAPGAGAGDDTAMAADQRTDASDTSRQGGIDIGRLREVVTFLTRVPVYWVVAVLVAVLLSCVTVTRAAGGGLSVRFALTSTAVWLLAIVWIPAVVRTLSVVLRSAKVFGVELSAAGLLELFRSHEPADATLLAPAGAQRDEAAATPMEELEVEEEAEEEAEGEAVDWVNRPDWTFDREEIYEENRELFLVHSIQPSRLQNQRYDVFVYLAGAHGEQPSDVVDQAEFFLGRNWGNQVYSVRNPGVGKTIGLRTSAYGPALCICRVTFKDEAQQPIILHRFLDFEMGWVFDAAAKALTASSSAG